MKVLPRWLDGAGVAIFAAASLSGCLGSRAPLLTGSDDVKLFGEHGAAIRVDFGPAGAPVHVEFAWRGDAYVIADPREPRSRALYRIAPIRENWLITERSDHDMTIYGLARRDGARLWTYSPACQDLPDDDRDALGLVIQPNGLCMVTSLAQLKSAMRKFTTQNPQPDGYFELIERAP